MDESTRVETSKFLSFVLRHRPQSVNVELDPQGWALVDALLAGCLIRGKYISRPMLDEVVETSPKRRFAFSEDGLRIRAVHGHSVEVDLGYKVAAPPSILFHGTTADRLERIYKLGLDKMTRQHVHLLADQEAAFNHAKFRHGRRADPRFGKAVVLEIQAGKMSHDGFKFYQSTSNIWLTDSVPPKYLSVK